MPRAPDPAIQNTLRSVACDMNVNQIFDSGYRVDLKLTNPRSLAENHLPIEASPHRQYRSDHQQPVVPSEKLTFQHFLLANGYQLEGDIEVVKKSAKIYDFGMNPYNIILKSNDD